MFFGYKVLHSMFTYKSVECGGVPSAEIHTASALKTETNMYVEWEKALFYPKIFI